MSFYSYKTKEMNSVLLESDLMDAERSLKRCVYR